MKGQKYSRRTDFIFKVCLVAILSTLVTFGVSSIGISKWWAISASLLVYIWLFTKLPEDPLSLIADKLKVRHYGKSPLRIHCECLISTYGPGPINPNSYVSLNPNVFTELFLLHQGKMKPEGYQRYLKEHSPGMFGGVSTQKEGLYKFARSLDKFGANDILSLTSLNEHEAFELALQQSQYLDVH